MPSVLGTLVEVALVFAGHVEVDKQGPSLPLHCLLDLGVVIQYELLRSMLVRLRVLCHDHNPCVGVHLVDLLHHSLEAVDGDWGHLMPVCPLAVEALEVGGPMLIIVVPGGDQRDVAQTRVVSNVRNICGVLGERAAGTVLALHTQVPHHAEAVLAAALPAIERKIPAAPANPAETARFEMLEVLRVVALRHHPRVELRLPPCGHGGDGVPQPAQGQMDLVHPGHPDQAAGADRIQPER
mmetsp:Transcript_9117/g.26937  ORF Transcript_9117/g.26937 Transcript_9117/m.26937 type:complete len:239 (-) Transcript_9117:514-1230(-)